MRNLRGVPYANLVLIVLYGDPQIDEPLLYSWDSRRSCGGFGSIPESDPAGRLSFEPDPLFSLQSALPQPHSRAAAVLFDEFDAAVFKRGSDLMYGFISSPQLTADRFQPSDRRF